MDYSTQSDEKKIGLLRNSNTIAVVGASNDPYTASHRIAKYLKQQGYKVIPVNPNYGEVLGEKCYPDLQSIPETVDLVDVFRRNDEILSVIIDAVAAKIPAIWLQSGMRCEEGQPIADAAGIALVQNSCIMTDHRRLLGQ